MFRPDDRRFEMMTRILFAASILLVALTGAALSGTASGAPTSASKASTMPPDGYAAQWWTHPKGCEYSRAGRPGEVVWYLIINTVRPGCPSYIVQHGLADTS